MEGVRVRVRARVGVRVRGGVRVRVGVRVATRKERAILLPCGSVGHEASCGSPCRQGEVGEAAWPVG